MGVKAGLGRDGLQLGLCKDRWHGTVQLPWCAPLDGAETERFVDLFWMLCEGGLTPVLVVFFGGVSSRVRVALLDTIRVIRVSESRLDGFIWSRDGTLAVRSIAKA